MNQPLLPGPPRSLPGASLLAFGRDPTGFLSDLASRYGDVVAFQLGPQQMVLLNHPDYIKDVLVNNQSTFVKGRALERAKRLLGDGLLTSEGELHQRQRRLAQPAFHRQRIAAYGTAMVRFAEEQSATWQPDQVVDFNQEMMRLTLRIVGYTLFASDTAADADAVAAAMHDLLQLFGLVRLPFFEQFMQMPLPQVRRFNAACARLDAIILRMIAERRSAGDDRGDLLSMLLLAQDAEGNGARMSDQQVRDEAMTIFLAGHETTANALSWTFYLLAQNPAVAEQLGTELDTALAGRQPSVEDLPQLSYTEMVFAEAMRLYPPAWIIGRRALQPWSVGGYHLPANSIALMSQWVTHHDARFFADPYRFDPERWTVEAKAARPKWSYFPFGGGPRTCIGEQFAWMEGVLLVAALARHWSPVLVPSHPVALQPSITLRPRHGLRMRLIPRATMV